MDPRILENLRSESWGLTETFEGKKGSWRRSRVIARVKEDQVDIEGMLLLDFLAQVKFTAEERIGKQAFWIDKDPANETFDNVGIMTLVGELSPGRPRLSGINAPSNSLEYQREYRDRNREKFRLASKKYQAKRRAAYEYMKATTKQERRTQAPDHMTASALTPEEIALSEKLEKLFEIPSDEPPKE